MVDYARALLQAEAERDAARSETATLRLELEDLRAVARPLRDVPAAPFRVYGTQDLPGQWRAMILQAEKEVCVCDGIHVRQ